MNKKVIFCFSIFLSVFALSGCLNKKSTENSTNLNANQEQPQPTQVQQLESGSSDTFSVPIEVQDEGSLNASAGNEQNNPNQLNKNSNNNLNQNANLNSNTNPKKMQDTFNSNSNPSSVGAPTESETKEYSQKYKGAVLKTNMGDITVKFYGSQSPKTVANFVKLSKNNFYNNVTFHRVIKDFMIQTGDPNSKDDDWSNDGMGGPGYSFQDEINNQKLVEGSLAMANAGPNTNGSQFFIVTAKATEWLDGKHTNFGEVTKGLEVVKKIENVKVNQNDHPLENVTIEKIELLEK